jgi:hypothetical protein
MAVDAFESTAIFGGAPSKLTFQPVKDVPVEIAQLPP